MFLNILVSSKTSYRSVAWCQIGSGISKLSAAYGRFFRSMTQNGFQRIKSQRESVSLRTLRTSATESQRIYQIREDFQQQLKSIAHVSRRENDDIIKILTFHVSSSKSLRRNSHSIVERVIQTSGFGKSIFLKIVSK